MEKIPPFRDCLYRFHLFWVVQMIRNVRTVGYFCLALLTLTIVHEKAEAQTIGNSMVTFLNGRVGTRVGGGECAHMAIEALRVAGGEFYRSDLGADSPASGDYVWGSLITVISSSNSKWTDSNPAVACLPGDVIQFGAGTKIATASYPTRHTAVVQAVNTKQRPSAVFQQNFNAVRSVKTATIDVTKLTAGWIRIYRPIPRINAANTWKFTIVNNASTQQTYSLMAGTTTVGTVTVAAANTAASFYVHKVTTTGAIPSIVNNSNTIYVNNAKGDEIYNPTTSTFGIRQLAQ